MAKSSRINTKQKLKSNGKQSRNGSYRGKQGRKDSDSKRINLDNARKDRVEKDIEEGRLKPGANDASEFHSGSQLIDAAGSLPFATILGNQTGPGNTTVPGIMVIDYAPSMFSGNSDIVNKAFQQIYSYIVHANSRNYKYEYTDLAMFTWAGMEVFVAIAEAVRAFGAIKTYREENMYLADTLVRALGFDPNSLRENLGNMWFDINALIMQTRQIWVPNIMPLLQRWIRMASTIYTDATGNRSQIYLYRRLFFYQLNETASTTGTALERASFQQNAGTSSSVPGYKVYNAGNTVTTAMTWPQFKSMIQLMINKLIASQDRGMIYGDILKAYGPEKIYAMPEVSVDYLVTLEYNAEVLTQIENVTCAYSMPQSIQQIQEPEPKIIECWSGDEFKSGTSIDGVPTSKQVLNFHIPTQPSPDMIAVATRLKSSSITLHDAYVSNNTYSAATGSSTALSAAETLTFAPVTTGTEIPALIYIWRKDSNDARGVSAALLTQQATTLNPNSSTSLRLQLMAFDWHPFVYLTESSGQTLTAIGSTPVQYVAGFGDFDNWIEITDVELKKLNDACLYGLLGIPQMG